MSADQDTRQELQEKLSAELAKVRAARAWHRIDINRVPRLMDMVEHERGERTRDALHSFLIDRLDPLGPDGTRALPLVDRDRQDTGLMMRWVFGATDETFQLDGDGWAPQDMSVTERFAALEEFRDGGRTDKQHTGQEIFRQERGNTPGGPARERLNEIIEEMLDHPVWAADGGRVLRKLSTRASSDGAGDDPQSKMGVNLAAEWAADSVGREIEERALELLAAPSKPLVLYGQPGTGKTVLAARLAQQLASSVIVIRGDGRGDAHGVYEFDLLEALQALGDDGRTWTRPALEHGLRDALAAQPEIAVVFDDVPPDVVRRLLPPTLAVPVIVTSRTPVGQWQQLAIGTFTREEAVAAATVAMPDQDPFEIQRLVTGVGLLPLAIRFAAALVDSQRHTLAELCSLVDSSLRDGLQILDGAGTSRGAFSLYYQALDDLDDYPRAAEILRRIAWLTSHPIAERHARESLCGDGSAGEYHAALLALEQAGLLTRTASAITINDLTRRIVRQRSLPDLARIANEFRQQCLDATSATPWMAMFGIEYQRFRRCVSRYFGAFPWEVWCLDSENWLLFDGGSSSDDEAENQVRPSMWDVAQLEITPGEVAEWSSRTQVRNSVVGGELRLVGHLTRLYAAAVVPLAQFDKSDTTFNNPFNDPAADVDNVVLHEPVQITVDGMGSSLLTACGRRMPVSPDPTLPHCADCQVLELRQRTAAGIEVLDRAIGPFIRDIIPVEEHLPLGMVEHLSAAAWSAQQGGESITGRNRLAGAAWYALKLPRMATTDRCLVGLVTRYLSASEPIEKHAKLMDEVADRLDPRHPAISAQLRASIERGDSDR